MSTHIRNEGCHSSNVAYVTQCVVPKGQESESLADLVRRVRTEKRLSLAEVHMRAKRAGHEIGTTHINRIENGFIEASSVTPRKLLALAAGLGVSEDEIFAVARGKTVSGDLELEEARLLEYFRGLPSESRDVLLAYAEMMSQRNSALGRRVPVITKSSEVPRQKERKRT